MFNFIERSWRNNQKFALALGVGAIVLWVFTGVIPDYPKPTSPWAIALLDAAKIISAALVGGAHYAGIRKIVPKGTNRAYATTLLVGDAILLTTLVFAKHEGAILLRSAGVWMLIHTLLREPAAPAADLTNQKILKELMIGGVAFALAWVFVEHLWRYVDAALQTDASVWGMNIYSLIGLIGGITLLWGKTALSDSKKPWFKSGSLQHYTIYLVAFVMMLLGCLAHFAKGIALLESFLILAIIFSLIVDRVVR